MAERSYNIAKLKAGLSSIIGEVSRVGEILVTDHNRPVARLVPVARIPPLPAGEVEALLSQEPVPLKRGSASSDRLVRTLREGDL